MHKLAKIPTYKKSISVKARVIFVLGLKREHAYYDEGYNLRLFLFLFLFFFFYLLRCLNNQPKDYFNEDQVSRDVPNNVEPENSSLTLFSKDGVKGATVTIS